MSTVTLTLRDPKYAPWGLLTEDEPPQMLVWLTLEEPINEIDSAMLSDWDVVRIIQSRNAGILEATGLEGFESVSDVPKVPKATSVPIVSPIRPKVASSETIMDVTQLMKKDAVRAQALEDRIKGSYPKIDKLLALPAHTLKKELKELAKGRALVSFFQEARKKEMAGKDRKTVVSVLTDIIQAKINAIGIDGQQNMQTGQTMLSDAYYDMIEEFEDEDEDSVESPTP